MDSQDGAQKAVDRLRVELAAWTTTNKPKNREDEVGRGPLPKPPAAYSEIETERIPIGAHFRRPSSSSGIKRVTPYLQLRRSRGHGPLGGGGTDAPASNPFEGMTDYMARRPDTAGAEVVAPRESRLGDVLRGETYQAEGGAPGRVEALGEKLKSAGATASEVEALKLLSSDPKGVDTALEGLTPDMRKRMEVAAATDDFTQRLRAEGVPGVVANRRADDYSKLVEGQTDDLRKEKVRAQLYQLGVPASVASQLLNMNYYEASQLARKIGDPELQKRVVKLLQVGLLMG